MTAINPGRAIAGHGAGETDAEVAVGNFLIGLVITVVALVAIVAAATFWVVSSVNNERVAPVTVVSAAGDAGRALLVVHPGLSDFPDKVAAAFAEGLAGVGWRIERTTPSREAPTDLAAYDLLIIASPIYGGLPAKPMQDYLARLADLGGKPVAIVLAGAGDTPAANEATAGLVAAVNGTVVANHAYTTMRPNEPPAGAGYAGSNAEIGIAMAREAGRTLTLSP